jgi:hypothetical protein
MSRLMAAIADSKVSGRIASAEKNLTFAARAVAAAASIAAALFASEREINAMSNARLANFAASARPRPSPAPTMAHTGFVISSSLASDGSLRTSIHRGARHNIPLGAHRHLVDGETGREERLLH